MNYENTNPVTSGLQKQCFVCVFARAKTDFCFCISSTVSDRNFPYVVVRPSPSTPVNVCTSIKKNAHAKGLWTTPVYVGLTRRRRSATAPQVSLNSPTMKKESATQNLYCTSTTKNDVTPDWWRSTEIIITIKKTLNIYTALYTHTHESQFKVTNFSQINCSKLIVKWLIVAANIIYGCKKNINNFLSHI